MDINNTKRVSVLVCFAGQNRRVEINKKKCQIKGKDFKYRALYKAEDGNTYLMDISSVPGTNGSQAKVIVYNRSGKQVIAERENVSVRFYKYLFI